MSGEDETRTFTFVADLVDGEIVHEELPVETLSDGTMRVLTSPGFVQGIARGDVVNVLDDDHRFEVVSRAGNVAVQIFCTNGLGKLEAIKAYLSDLEAGEIDGATDGLVVLTFPVTATFQRIESITESVAEHFSAECWQYGNVYSDDDKGEPLNWWLKS